MLIFMGSRHFPNNSMILLREIGHFWTPITQDPLTFGQCQTIALMWGNCNGMLQILFPVCQNECNVTAKVLIIYQIIFFKLIPKSISEFPKVWKTCKMKKVFPKFSLFFRLTLHSFKRNWWQNQKRAMILNDSDH